MMGGIQLKRKQNLHARAIIYRKVLFIMIVCLQLLVVDAAIASSLSIGEGYVNYGGTKDVYSLPDKDSDIIAALAVGAPCDILSISGDWIEIRMHTEMLGFFTGWVTADNIAKAAAGDPVLPGNDPVVLITPTPVAQATIPPVFVEKTSAPQTTIPQEEAQWTSPLPGYTAYCTAVVNNSNGQRLNLRSLPSTQSESLGLYYTGAEVICYSDPSQEWAYVSVGNRYGYMKTEFLYFGSDPESIPPQTPIAYVTNNEKNAWLNLRSQPSTEAKVLGKYYNGDRVTVIGKVNDWYHVKANNTYGFMLASYLALTDASASTQQGTLRQYSTTQYILRGYTIDASMTEIAKDAFDIGVQIIIDPSVKLNSYPSSFNLYINGVKECNIGTVQNSSIVGIPIPVNSDGTESLDEAVYLK